MFATAQPDKPAWHPFSIHAPLDQVVRRHLFHSMTNRLRPRADQPVQQFDLNIEMLHVDRKPLLARLGSLSHLSESDRTTRRTSLRFFLRDKRLLHWRSDQTPCLILPDSPPKPFPYLEIESC